MKMSNKRKSRFFETYIIKILKENISKDAEICKDSKQQINGIFKIFTQEIVNIIYMLMKDQKKNTINCLTVENAIKIFLSGDLKKNAIQIATDVLNGIYNLIIPGYLLEKFLRKFNNSNYKISKKSIIYMTAIIEYLIGEVLDLAFTYTKYQKRLRINVGDIEQSLREDIEFEPILLKYNIYFINGQKLPTLDNEILKKYKKKKINGKLRHLPGNKSLQIIKKLQLNRTKLILPISKFKQFIRIFLEKKISEPVFKYLQYFLEEYLISIFHKAQIINNHNKKNRVSKKDIELYCKLNNINYIKNLSEQNLLNNNEIIVESNSNNLIIDINDDTEEISDVENPI